MFHWIRDGEKIHNGLSIYHPKDEGSIGGCIRFGRRLLRVRYSKNTKRWIFRYDIISIKDWEEFSKNYDTNKQN